MELKPLFRKSSTGAILRWTIWTEGAEIVIEHGQLDGRMQISRRACTPKNVGKANETSAETQAEAEALAEWTHKVERKYSQDVNRIHDFEIDVMLAPNEKWIDKDKPKNSTNVRAQYPGDIQPKLDGARCLAYWDGDRVVLMTRGRKEWTMPHIQEQLAKILPKDAMWDGELYCHGFKRQTIQKWLSNNYPESKKIMYCVYDVPIRDGEHKIWAERKVDLDEMVPGKAMQPDLAYPNIMKVLTLEVQDEDQVNACDEKFVEAGFEGSMFRNRKGPYEWGKRSKNLLKIKRFDDAEFEIVGWLEAEGGHAGCVIWLCSTVKGAPIVGYVEAKPKSTTLFKVVPNGSLPDRREWLRDAESFMRKELTVKYQGFSHDGLPQIAKGIAIRLPEDKSAPKAKKAKKGA